MIFAKRKPIFWANGFSWNPKIFKIFQKTSKRNPDRYFKKKNCEEKIGNHFSRKISQNLRENKYII